MLANDNAETFVPPLSATGDSMATFGAWETTFVSATGIVAV